MIDLYIFDIHEKYSYDLPNVIMDHINKYSNLEKRNASLITYSHLVDILTAKGFDCNNFYFSKEGKGLLDGVYFSISHSNNYSVIAVSINPVGVDCEEIITYKRLGLSKKILNDKEYQEYELESNKSEYLTRKWTLKEAYGKFLGTGLTSEVFKWDAKGYTYTLSDAIIGVYPFDEVNVWKKAK